MSHTLRAPRLRCSTPGAGRRLRGTVAGTSRVRQGPGQDEREAVIRLDKAAEEIIDWLDRVGGSMAISKLAEIVGVRANNLRSRVIPKLVVAGVVTVDEDTAALVEAWLENLDDEREMTGEFEAHDRDEARYKREREEYRSFLEGETGDELDGQICDRHEHTPQAATHPRGRVAPGGGVRGAARPLEASGRPVCGSAAVARTAGGRAWQKPAPQGELSIPKPAVQVGPCDR